MARERPWDYSPSIPAGIIAAIIFGGLTAGHLFHLFRRRTLFCIPIVIGGVFETIGYASRVAGHYSLYSLPPYIIQALLILLAPIFFAATAYMILGRIIYGLGAESYSILRINWITKIFVGGDILCFLTQLVGAGMLSGANDLSGKKRGERVILVGLILQIVIFLFFLLTALMFHKRMRAHPKGDFFAHGHHWERFLFMLYGVSIMITLRNIFRAIEYALGETGYLLQHEWPTYCFDGLLMAIVLGVCLQWHVGKVTPRFDPISQTAEYPLDNEHP